MEAQAEIVYFENKEENQLSKPVDYFFNSRRVNDFNSIGLHTGQRGEIEIIIRDIYLELNAQKANMTVNINGKSFKILEIEPVSGLGMEATFLIGVETNG